MAKYSLEDTGYIVSTYKENPTQEIVVELAKKYDVTPRSIIAKLSSLGVYQKKKYLSKSGELPVKKARLADKLGKLLGLHDFEIEQLEKLSKPLIIKITEIYTKMENNAYEDC